MKHVTPPTGQPVEAPQDVAEALAPKTARRAHKPRKSLSDAERLAKGRRKLERLRKEAAAHIDRLIELLDLTDGFATTELELEDEHDESTNDDEPSIGSLSSNGGDQSRWGKSDSWQFIDTEDEHDGGEPDDECDGKPDYEPSLGWCEGTAQGQGRWGGTDDREAAVEPVRRRLSRS